jgi:hypothetical protein
LKLHERGPIRVKSVKNLRVDGIGGLNPFLVISVVALRRKLGVLSPVKVGKGPCNYVAVLEKSLVGEGFEESPPYDFETFFGTSRPP